MDPYEEVSQQGQAPPLSPAYVPDPMELDEHVPAYVLEPEHPEYHVPSDDDMQIEDQPYADDASPIAESPGHITDSESMEEDSIDYLDEPEDDDEDSEEDPEEDHTDYPVDGGDGDDEPSDDEDDDDTDDEDEEPTEDEDDDEDEEEHLAPADSSTVPVVDHVPSAGDTEAFETDEARKTVILEPPMPASMEARIAEHVAAPIPLTSPAYDQEPLAKSSAAVAARPPKGQYDFIDTVEAEQGLIRSHGHDARTIARAADRAEDVRRQESEDFYTQLHDARTDRIDIRLEIDVVRGQRNAYETELHERQSAEDLAVRQMMRIRVLEARARIDTVEDTGSSC
nr:hypothetical protein [Tanacetum cinerariifolium]